MGNNVTNQNFTGINFESLPEKPNKKTRKNGISVDNLAGSLFNVSNVFGMAKTGNEFKREHVLGYFRQVLEKPELKKFRDAVKATESKKIDLSQSGEIDQFINALINWKANPHDKNNIEKLQNADLPMKTYSAFETSVTHVLQKLEKTGVLKRGENNSSIWVIQDANRLREEVAKYGDVFQNVESESNE